MCIRDSPNAVEALAAHVATSCGRLKDLDGLASGLAGAETLGLELRCCALVVEGIPRDASGARLKSKALAMGALRSVTGYLLDVAFSAPGARDLDRGSPGWSDACARAALPHALATLGGLIRSHPEGAAVAAAATSTFERVPEATPDVTPEAEAPPRRTLLRLLHALEPVTERGVGTLAENALECVEEIDAAAAEAIAELRRATKASNAQKAMERREKMLREMGLTRLSPASPSLGNPTHAQLASPTGSLGATSPQSLSLIHI